jgi:hypothetical protein
VARSFRFPRGIGEESLARIKVTTPKFEVIQFHRSPLIRIDESLELSLACTHFAFQTRDLAILGLPAGARVQARMTCNPIRIGHERSDVVPYDAIEGFVNDMQELRDAARGSS